MKKMLLAPVWIVGLSIMALGTYIVIICERLCDDLKGFLT